LSATESAATTSAIATWRGATTTITITAIAISAWTWTTVFTFFVVAQICRAAAHA
jgi:hypothetical protein